MARRIATIVGARPQFIKAAPVSGALAAAGIDETLIHTGQHFDPLMSEVFFRELGLRTPAHNLDIHGLAHGAMTGRMLERIEILLDAERPDLVLVYGDTNSTLAGALAAAKLNIPVAHVEAGLRSFNRRMPEENNRILTDHLSRLLFCPTRTAVANLAREGITADVHANGDVMYDAALEASARAALGSDILARFGLPPGGYAVATVHRAENTDDCDRLVEVLTYIAARAAERPVILVAHPRTRDRIERWNIRLDGVRLVEPLGYLDMTWLVRNAAAILTDSGGLQKEAYFHRVPCVTLREETEWVETLDSGWNRLWRQPRKPQRSDIADYGCGDSAARIVAVLKDFLDAAN